AGHDHRCSEVNIPHHDQRIDQNFLHNDRDDGMTRPYPRSLSLAALSLELPLSSLLHMEREAALCRVGVDRQDLPANPVRSGRQLLQPDPHGACADRWLAEIDARAVGVTYFNRAERRFQVLRIEKCEFSWGRGYGAADARFCMIEKSVGLCASAWHDGKQDCRCWNRDAHGLPQKVSLRVGAELPPNSGCPMLLGKMSSRYKWSWARTPTPVPLSRLIGIMASIPTWK